MLLTLIWTGGKGCFAWRWQVWMKSRVSPLCFCPQSAFPRYTNNPNPPSLPLPSSVVTFLLTSQERGGLMSGNFYLAFCPDCISKPQELDKIWTAVLEESVYSVGILHERHYVTQRINSKRSIQRLKDIFFVYRTQIVFRT